MFGAGAKVCATRATRETMLMAICGLAQTLWNKVHLEPRLNFSSSMGIQEATYKDGCVGVLHELRCDAALGGCTIGSASHL